MKRISLEEWRMEGETLVLLGTTCHRARNVLRVREGETIIGTDGRGNELTLGVTEVRPDRILARLVEKRRDIGESPLSVVLAQAVPRSSRMDLVIQKATELGAAAIVPIVSSHSVARPSAGSQGHRLGRWQKIAAEAVAQSRRTLAPRISPPMTLIEYLAAPRAPLGLVLHNGPGTVTFSALADNRPGAVEVVVGPEGGFSPAEVEACRTAGLIPLSLGPRVLRTETAGLVILALLQQRWGDLG